METAEEIDKATGIRFNKSPATVVEEATRAKEITIALQVFLRDLRLNTPEAAEAQALLDAQVNKLDLIITNLQSDGDKQAAEKTFRQMLQDVLEAYAKVLSEGRTTRGILAAAAIALMSVAGVDVGVVVGTLVAGSIVGVDAKALKNILKGWKTKNKPY